MKFDPHVATARVQSLQAELASVEAMLFDPKLLLPYGRTLHGVTPQMDDIEVLNRASAVCMDKKRTCNDRIALLLFALGREKEIPGRFNIEGSMAGFVFSPEDLRLFPAGPIYLGSAVDGDRFVMEIPSPAGNGVITVCQQTRYADQLYVCAPYGQAKHLIHSRTYLRLMPNPVGATGEYLNTSCFTTTGILVAAGLIRDGWINFRELDQLVTSLGATVIENKWKPTHRYNTGGGSEYLMLVPDGRAFNHDEYGFLETPEFMLQPTGQWLFKGQAFDGPMEELSKH